MKESEHLGKQDDYRYNVIDEKAKRGRGKEMAQWLTALAFLAVTGFSSSTHLR